MSNPYSYVTQGGVANTRPKVSDDTATLADLREAFHEPIPIDTDFDTYQGMSKRDKGNIKRHLPYFVGSKRDDAHVKARTFLTLDIEQANHDVPPPSPESVAERLAELGGEGWVYTSLSHTDDSPRYRVVLPLGKPLDASDDVSGTTAQLRASTQAAAKKLGVEEWTQPESWVLSQAMYLPAVLDGGTYYESYHPGKAWKAVAARVEQDGKVLGKPDWDAAADGAKSDVARAEGKPDLVLQALKVAGLYLRENAKHKGMHYIACPFLDEHESENDTQTVYYEANYDGNPRAAVKCFDTAPDVDGKPHLTMISLVKWLRENEFMTQAEQLQTGVMDDDATFLAKANLLQFITTPPTPREWAIEQFAPVGKVTVVAGPGGVSKSMLVLHMAMYAAIGKDFGPFKPSAPIRTLAVSYEDDRQEMHKRVNALIAELSDQDDGISDMLYDIKGQLASNLLMYAADDDASAWLILTKPDRFGPAERTERVNWLIGFLQRNSVRLLILDPAVYTHQLEENDISDMAIYMQTLSAIAKQANCAVLVVHHMSKAGAWAQLDDINQGSLRGASSFADNARSVGVVVSMPTKDAPLYGLPADHNTVTKYAVFKHVKHNYSASLGTFLFERKGALLMPRPDLQRLEQHALAEAKARQLTQDEEYRDMSSAEAVLKYLDAHDDFISQSQVAIGAHIHKRRIAQLLETYAERDLVETEESSTGSRRSVTVRITRVGKAWLAKREANEHLE
jgi:hypothetical protein